MSWKERLKASHTPLKICCRGALLKFPSPTSLFLILSNHCETAHFYDFDSLQIIIVTRFLYWKLKLGIVLPCSNNLLHCMYCCNRL